MNRVLLIRAFSISFLIGVFVASVSIDATWLAIAARLAYVAAIVLLFLAIVFRKALYIILFALLLGFWYVPFRYDVPYSSTISADVVNATGVVVFSDLYTNKQRLTVALTEPAEFAQDRIFLYSSRYPLYESGASLAFRCTFAVAEPFDDFAYDKYVARKGVDYICSYPYVSAIEQKETLFSWLFQVKEYYAQVFTRTFHEPESSVIKAMVLARNKEISPKVRSDFAAAGISHVIAISGLHISLLILIAEAVLVNFGIGLRSRFAIIGIAISMYIILLGFPPSAVRSTIMASLLLGARVTGRPYAGIHSLLLVATAMVAINPLILLFDVGFQLSFLALSGILLTMHYWQYLFRFIPEKFALRSVVSLTFAAQIFTWPLIMYNFHIFSVIAPLTNILVMGLVGPILVTAFLLPVVALVPIIAPFIALPLYFMLKTMISLAAWAASIPWSSVQSESFSVAHLIASYAVLILLYLALRYGTGASSRREENSLKWYA